MDFCGQKGHYGSPKKIEGKSLKLPPPYCWESVIGLLYTYLSITRVFYKLRRTTSGAHST
jgi:hypothetical protein